MVAASIALLISVPLSLILDSDWSPFSFQRRLLERDNSHCYFAVRQNDILSIVIMPWYLPLPL